MASHPALYDTGIFSKTEPTIYVVADETNPTEVQFAQKIADYSNGILVNYFGRGIGQSTEIISKESPRVSLIDKALTSQYSPASLYRLFSDFSPDNMLNLFTKGLLTHKEAEIISQLEIQYKHQFENVPSFSSFNFFPSS